MESRNLSKFGSLYKKVCFPAPKSPPDVTKEVFSTLQEY